MSRGSRWLLIATITLLYGGAAFLWPDLAAAKIIQGLSGISVLTTILVGWLFTQLNAVTGVGVLRGREMERYTIKRQEMRGRFWRVFWINALATALLFLLAAIEDQLRDKWWYTFAVGLLTAVLLSNAFLLVGWINDISRFADKLRAIEQDRKEHAEEIKRLEASAKS